MMNRWLFCLLLACGIAQAAPIVVNGPTLRPAAGGNLTVQTAQTSVAATQAFGTANTLVVTLASNPSQNNLVACAVVSGSPDFANPESSITISADTFGDAGSWNSASLNPVTKSLYTGWVFYKTLSANASNKTITVKAAGTDVPALTAVCRVLSTTSGTPTWAVDGTPVSLTGTTPGGGSTITTGSITTTNTSTYVMGVSADAGAAFTAGSGFTGYTATYDGNWTVFDEGFIPTSSGAKSVTFTDPTGGPQDYLTLGIAFKAN